MYSIYAAIICVGIAVIIGMFALSITQEDSVTVESNTNEQWVTFADEFNMYTSYLMSQYDDPVYESMTWSERPGYIVTGDSTDFRYSMDCGRMRSSGVYYNYYTYIIAGESYLRVERHTDLYGEDQVSSVRYLPYDSITYAMVNRMSA